MKVIGFHDSDLMYMLNSSRIFVARSCVCGLRLRGGVVMFMEYISHS